MSQLCPVALEPCSCDLRPPSWAGQDAGDSLVTSIVLSSPLSLRVLRARTSQCQQFLYPEEEGRG